MKNKFIIALLMLLVLLAYDLAIGSVFEGMTSNEVVNVKRYGTVLIMDEIVQSIKKYQVDNKGKLPTSLALIENVCKRDLWDGRLSYMTDGKEFLLASNGPDRKCETYDDIEYMSNTNIFCQAVLGDGKLCPCVAIDDLWYCKNHIDIIENEKIAEKLLQLSEERASRNKGREALSSNEFPLGWIVFIVAIVVFVGLRRLNSYLNNVHYKNKKIAFEEKLRNNGGELPVLKSDSTFVLKDGEYIHVYSVAMLKELVTRRVCKSHGTSSRLFGSVRIHSGTSTSESRRELREIERGDFAITNQRVVFTGNIESRVIELSKIHSFSANTVCLRILVTGKKGEYLEFYGCDGYECLFTLQYLIKALKHRKSR